MFVFYCRYTLYVDLMSRKLCNIYLLLAITPSHKFVRMGGLTRTYSRSSRSVGMENALVSVVYVYTDVLCCKDCSYFSCDQERDGLKRRLHGRAVQRIVLDSLKWGPCKVPSGSYADLFHNQRGLRSSVPQ
jgi:hypothetical protein